ncbi:PREDICTED: solute carrier family 25 member 44-like [Priapulus caudatus]|uniref:Solute carrier family 25 member 44-like n=1 Tax=Priapulus caudatus TaxID=37621 RepID=A0ABM1EJS5_PRICU|nr:PREDICTED: solute carrier family 25 member 44-like [Priapulus caudatus]XP_014672446.1 PREDICTED: solute carrier family 25 member 44-like [Priapulus caudatus]XP_014672447.1 PREDICTED: solute carrier family 25 member 44-like [Priapulus caudatus]XP_014672448.1 PREDICTED: solute carrier family 25 member 44-like [Priapulus caudatus]XP_014672449.1 PREDICTED: solute carrier family 25 member 44-like [Priapulus caudatus]XP_014672450.1 PREDICTED: solute carrier family 25 member 44-like [Priapulus cau
MENDDFLVGIIDDIIAHQFTPQLPSQRRSFAAEDELRTIDWHMLDKHKFYPLSMTTSFSIRCLLYPFTVIKTRLQIQRQKTLYKGTFDAFYKILRYEGPTGLYKGFWINSIQVVSGVGYVTTYEGVRHMLSTYTSLKDNKKIQAMAGGACASLVGQTIIVPFDVVSQHMMVMGQFSGRNRPSQVTVPTLGITVDLRRGSTFNVSMAIIRELYKNDGLGGFYRGYGASIMCFVPNSALWWMFYHLYADALNHLTPNYVPHLLIQCVAAPLGGATTALLTNPLDITRARIQVERHPLMWTVRKLWRQERMAIFTKGLSARIIQSLCFSFFIILGYESIKRMSVKEEYKSEVHW